VQQFDPPLLPSKLMQLLARQLNPASELRGRPAKQAPKVSDIVRWLTVIERNDLPNGFVVALKKRITSRKGLTSFEIALPLHKMLERRTRDFMICEFYRNFRDLIKKNELTLTHPIFGTFEIPDDHCSRSDKALLLTQSLLSSAGYGPPSTRRMLNIVAEQQK
jgi:hypothetical protein